MWLLFVGYCCISDPAEHRKIHLWNGCNKKIGEVSFGSVKAEALWMGTATLLSCLNGTNFLQKFVRV